MTAKQMDDVAARQRDLPAGERDSIATSYGAIALLTATLALASWLFPRRASPHHPALPNCTETQNKMNTQQNENA